MKVNPTSDAGIISYLAQTNRRLMDFIAMQEEAYSRNEDILKLHIAELEAERRWIPVSERLPEKDGYYLVSDDHDGVLSCEFMTGRRFQPLWEVPGVLYWMPLPEPPEVEQ